MKRLMTICTMLLLASCSKSGIEEQTTIDRKIEYHAYLPDAPAGESRTYVDENFRLRWVNDDRITIFDGNTFPSEYKNTGYTGANWASYTQVTSPGKFDTKIPVSTNVAVYPHSIYNLLDESDLFVTLTMPAEQTYAENSFGPNANTMIAITKDVNDGSLYFKNVGTYLNVRLWGADQTVKSITITATGGEPLSGKAIVTPTYGGDPTCAMANTETSPSVKLICEEAVTVNTTKETPVSFWIVLPPVTMEHGFTATVENAEGETQKFIINQSVTFVRNKYNTLTRELTISETIAPSSAVPSNQIWYTSSDETMIEPVATGESVFGATITSHTYNNGLGVITFSGDVTQVGSNAFNAKTKLATISLPETVTEIGSYAFQNCTRLTDISAPKMTTISNYAFDNCAKLAAVPFASNLTSVGSYAFQKCTSLISLDLKNVTSLGSYAFDECSNLEQVTLLALKGSIGEYAFYGCSRLKEINIPDGVTTIGMYAFSRCSSLISVHIGHGLQSSKANAFEQCQSLQSVYISDLASWCSIDFAATGVNYANTYYSYPCFSNPCRNGASLYLNGELVTAVIIPEGMEEIGSAFQGCTSLTSIVLPNSMTCIGNSAFEYCTSLSSVTIPDSVVKIGHSAFYNCSALTSVTIPDSVAEMGTNVFSYCTSLTLMPLPESITRIEANTFSNCDVLTSVVIPERVTTIGENSFSSCDALASVTIPEGVTTIGERAFYACHALTSVTISKGVTTIGFQAFSYCDALTSITIPESVTTIESNAFFSCSVLTAVYCKPITPPTLGHYSVFYKNASDLKFYVPASEDDGAVQQVPKNENHPRQMYF